MNELDYVPCPVDTSQVALSSALDGLVEALAKNVHENWALGRMKEGWTWGPVRNDALKQHPCLVAYEQLPDSEKDYDRATAMETLKLITQLGFEIRPKS
ncbi:RyR domain-containing protein [gut metagenome]|uniref:RyR domain-containing protein n=1 Tax=gut metagenome TaxID=749906 RepID=J9GI30_9ZZZZ